VPPPGPRRVGVRLPGRPPPGVVPTRAIRRPDPPGWRAPVGAGRGGRHGDGPASLGGPVGPGGHQRVAARHRLEGRLWAAPGRRGVPPHRPGVLAQSHPPLITAQADLGGGPPGGGADRGAVRAGSAGAGHHRLGRRGRHPGHRHPAGGGDPSGPPADPGGPPARAGCPRLRPARQAPVRLGRSAGHPGAGVGAGQRRAGAVGGGRRPRVGGRAGRGGGAAGPGRRPGRRARPAAGKLADRPAGRHRAG
jgi:hypothetical protein